MLEGVTYEKNLVQLKREISSLHCWIRNKKVYGLDDNISFIKHERKFYSIEIGLCGVGKTAQGIQMHRSTGE